MNKPFLYTLRLISTLLMAALFSGCHTDKVDAPIDEVITDNNIDIPTEEVINIPSKEAELIDGGIYLIRNQATNRVLSMQLAGMVDGVSVLQYKESGNLSELWRVKKTDTGYTFTSVFCPRSIDIKKDNPEENVEIVVKAFDNESLIPSWKIYESGDAYQITYSGTDLLIGLNDSTIQSSNYPRLTVFNNEEYQLWNLEYVSLSGDIPYLLPVDGAVYHSSCPEIVKYEDTYYMYIMAPGISIKSSKDLITWEHAGQAFPNSDPEWMRQEVPGYGIWAPGVYMIGDLYYLYYCISTSGSQNSAIGVAVNKTLDVNSPDFKWIDKGMVLRSDKDSLYNCIDPNIVIDEKGDVWLTFGSYWNGIYQYQINPETGFLLDASSEPIHLAKRYGSGGAIEAPFMIKRDEYYYLFTAFNPMDKDYHNRVGRSESIHGPFVDKDGTPMLRGGGTEVSKAQNELLMPAHASVFLDDDGQYYFVSEYFREKSSSIMLIGTIVWDKDGWPLTALTPDVIERLQDYVRK